MRASFCAMAIVAGTLGAGVAPAAAQTPRAEPRIEVAVTGGLVGPVSFGTAEATLTAGSGAPLVIFRTDNRLAPGAVFEAHVGQRIGGRLMAELSGAWQRANFESRVTDDFEDAEDVTLTERSSRFTVEGALLVAVATTPRWSVFVRGGGGWMRELAGGGSLVEDGAVASVGAGMKYWWRDAAASGPNVGLRVEGRVSARSAGLTLGESGWRVAPVVTGGIAFAF